MQVRLLVILLTGLSLTACGTAHKKDFCSETNWQDQGQKDGAKGLASDTVMGEQEKCSKVGVEIPLRDYKEGWLVGIKQYCSENNAFELGKNKKKNKVENCPIEYRPKFEAAYAKGQNLNELDKEIEDVNEKIKSADKEKESLEKQVRKKREEIDKLESKQAELKSGIKDIQKSKGSN